MLCLQKGMKSFAQFEETRQNRVLPGVEHVNTSCQEPVKLVGTSGRPLQWSLPWDFTQLTMFHPNVEKKMQIRSRSSTAHLVEKNTGWTPAASLFLGNSPSGCSTSRGTAAPNKAKYLWAQEAWENMPKIYDDVETWMVRYNIQCYYSCWNIPTFLQVVLELLHVYTSCFITSSGWICASASQSFNCAKASSATRLPRLCATTFTVQPNFDRSNNKLAKCTAASAESLP